MAISYVGGGKATGTSNFTVTYTVTAGNLVVCAAESWSATATFAISDSASQTWTAGEKVTQSTFTTQLFYKENSSAITWVNVVITNNGGTGRLSVGEWSGVATTGSYEGHHSGSDASNNTVSSGNFTVTDGDLIVGACLSPAGNLAQGSGFTLQSATSDGVLGLESKIMSGTTASATHGGSWGVQVSLGAGFLPAATNTTPTVTTAAITAIAATTATSGGNVTADGGASVTARGVCWGTSSNPTTADSKTTDSSGTGSFSSSITSLTAGTTYHVRAYATNSEGTAYGSDLAFCAWAVAAHTFYVDTASSGGDGTTTALSGTNAAFATTNGAQGGSYTAGDSILFRKGCSWTSSTFTVPTQGATGNHITLGAYGTGAKPIIAGAANNPAITVTAANRGYWTVDGLDLRGTGQVTGINASLSIYFNYWSGADMGAVPGWIVQNCTFNAGVLGSGPNFIVQDNTFDGTGNAYCINGAVTLRGENTSGSIIRRNIIHNWIDRGVWVFCATGGGTSPSVTVNNNTIYSIVAGSSQDGVGINFDGAANYVESGVAYGNTIYSCDGYGISHENCVNHQTYNNLIHDVGSIGMTFMHYGAWRNYNMNSVVHHNIIYNTNIGLCMIYGAYWSYYNNVIYGDTGANSSGFKVLDNTTYTNHLNFENNIIAGGWDYPINVPDNAAIWTSLDYNDIVPAGTLVMIQISGGNKTLAQLQALGYMAHGFTTDPTFTNTGTHDFTLQSASPCRNTGTNVGLTTDYAGTAIGLVPDMGAYEYPAVVPTLTTTAISAITKTTAASGGNVSDAGDATVSARGVCWGTSSNPTVAGSKTSNGPGSGRSRHRLPALLRGPRTMSGRMLRTAWGRRMALKLRSRLPLPWAEVRLKWA